ncbi:MAG TPA: hypothetical protein VEC18_11075 [Myxococcota bacterium]|nr:hypothetical protein [Myxococcota bacterium]
MGWSCHAPRRAARARGARPAAAHAWTRRAAGLAAIVAPALARAASPLAEPQLPDLAYLDPGAGSLLLQALVAAVAGAALAISAYWRKIRAFFGRGSRARDRSDRAPRDD